MGQVVACAGNEFAFHAEYNWVPTNLCVAVPDAVDPRLAAFATVGAIAMQGVRQGDAQIGDTACVIGLGLVGQLVVRLLVASGVQVVGLDVVAERCALAEKAGAALCRAPDEDGLAAVEAALAKASGGLGADRVFLVAGGSSNEPAEVAARLARDRATIVDIGKCKLDLPWSAYYEKELDLRFSRSYGPGRYDPQYEVQGVDYPAGYVRWTERRNLACFVDLVARGEIDLEPLVAATFPLTDAVEVYERLQAGGVPGVGLPVRVPQARRVVPGRAPCACLCRGDDPRAVDADGGGRRRRCAPRRWRARALRVGFIGAGNYARSMLLPHLAGRPDVELARVATLSSLSAVNAKRKFGFTTVGHRRRGGARRRLHRRRVHRHPAQLPRRARRRKALEAGKAVFVEKPLALRLDQLDELLATVDATGNDRLMVGFNRRFSPMFERDAGALRSVHRAHRGPLPRQRRPCGHGQLVRATRKWRGRASPERAGTSSTR